MSQLDETAPSLKTLIQSVQEVNKKLAAMHKHQTIQWALQNLFSGAASAGFLLYTSPPEKGSFENGQEAILSKDYAFGILSTFGCGQEYILPRGYCADASGKAGNAFEAEMNFHANLKDYILELTGVEPIIEIGIK
ncbi:hypothetical protein HDU97_008977 [Phlyctochytrium planicorne]|nr:hypothetical protein HDU97_008977 [Phlyctochytrium planicorne]